MLFPTTSLDVRPVHIARGSYGSIVNDIRQFDGAAAQYAIERNRPYPISLEEIAREIPKYIKGKPPLRNFFTFEPIREEPTPGNLTLQKNTNGAVSLYFHDLFNQPHLVATFTNSISPE